MDRGGVGIFAGPTGFGGMQGLQQLQQTQRAPRSLQKAVKPGVLAVRSSGAAGGVLALCCAGGQ